MDRERYLQEREMYLENANDFLGRDDKVLSVSDISGEIDDIGKVTVNEDYNDVYSGNIHLKAFF